MSTLISKNVQIGADGTASNNFTIYQPASPDGTLRIGNGNTGTTSAQVVLTSAGNVGIGTSAPGENLDVVASESASNVAIRARNISTTTNSVSAFVLQGGNGAVNASMVADGLGSVRFAGAWVGTDSNHPFAFLTNSTERMRIDSAGNVGIGIVPPANTGLFSWLLVSGLNIGGSNGEGGLFANAYYDTSAGSYKYIFSKAASRIYLAQDANIIFDNAPSGTAGNNVTFTERARITSSGAIWAGNTTRQSTDNHTFIASVTTTDWTTNFQNNASSGAPLGILINYSSIAPNNTGSFFIRTQDSSTQRFEVRSNGGIANFSGNNVNLSDRREKTNFAPAKSYLETICAIPVQTFNYIDQNLEEDPGLTLGVVAQDVQEVAPELVMESNWGTKEEPKMRLSVYQTDLQYALMKCIQEQQAIINELKTRIEALEGTQP
jgi:hypothetical protein